MNVKTSVWIIFVEKKAYYKVSMSSYQNFILAHTGLKFGLADLGDLGRWNQLHTPHIYIWAEKSLSVAIWGMLFLLWINRGQDWKSIVLILTYTLAFHWPIFNHTSVPSINSTENDTKFIPQWNGCTKKKTERMIIRSCTLIL